MGNMKRRLILMAALASVVWGESDSLLEWMNRLAQAQLDERERVLAGITDRAAADARRRIVREKVLELIGGLPVAAGAVRARKTGEIAASGYRIEKILYESLPGIWVSANVYTPERGGRYPGILMPIGHTQEGKPEGQLLAANLALQGYVVLAYDPIGQGEREQTYVPMLGRALSGGGGNEHIELGARSLMLGQSVARYFIQDARRGLDYLEQRPDVDRERLGVTGCSGGGCITTYIAALDPRVKVAAPGCFINTFRVLFAGSLGDSEMSLPRLLASGLDLADFFEMAAPLPWLMLATTEDYFTPEGARPVYEETKRFYRLYGAEERVEFSVADGPHGTPKGSREAIYRWLDRWLRDGKNAGADREVKLHTSRELWVTKSGNVAEIPGSRKLYQVIHDEWKRLWQPRPVEELRSELRRLGAPTAGRAPRVTAKRETVTAIYRLEELKLESEPGIEVAAKLYVPVGGGNKPGVVVVEEKRLPVPLFVQRSQSTAALVEGMVNAGAVVLELEPRDSPGAWEGRPFLGNWITNQRADLIGKNLAVMRVHDIVGGVDFLASRAEVDRARIGAYGRGVKGVWVLLGALVDSRVSRIWLDRTPHSLRVAFANPMASHLFDAMIPGFARHWDYGAIAEALAPRSVYWTDPTNWMNQVVEAGSRFRYRYVYEGDAGLVQEFLKPLL